METVPQFVQQITDEEGKSIMRKQAVIVGIVTLAIVLMASLSGSAALDTGYFYEKNYDLGGETITFVHWVDNEIPDEARAAAEARFNCKIEWRNIGPWENYEKNILAAVMAGDSENWIIKVVVPDQFVKVVTQGALFPIDTVVPADILADDALASTLSWKGHIYSLDGGAFDQVKAFGNEPMELPEWPFAFVVYNKSIVEREGLTDPYELYKNGEWNMETMGELAKQATKDLDGDGVTDQWGFAGLQTRWFTPYADAFTFVDGRLMFTLADDEETQKVIETMRKWALEDKSAYRWYWPGWDIFHEGKALFATGREYVFLPGSMRDEWGILPIPWWFREECNYNMSQNQGALPVNSKNPEAMIALFNFVFSYMQQTEEDALNGYYNRVSQYARDEQSAEIMIVDIPQMMAETEYGTVPYGAWWLYEIRLSDKLDEIIWQNKGYRAVLDAWTPEVQAELDEMFNN